MKNFIKNIVNVKGRIVNKNSYINIFSVIKGYNNLKLGDLSWIGNGVKINAKNGVLKLGEKAYLNNNCDINIIEGSFSLGDNSFLNENCNVIVLGNIRIGDNVMIAPNSCLISGNHNFENKNININEQGYCKKDIVIKDNVWIGCNSIILGDVTIESGAIIGAGSVVTKNVGENEIWAGNPAKFIKKR